MRFSPILPIALRHAALGFAAGAGLLVVAGPGAAQALAGHDSSAPVSYSADRIELQDKANRVVLSGHVEIAQGDMHLGAGRTTVAYDNSGGGLHIQRIDATGGVTVSRGGESASGDVAVYDFARKLITLVGNVQLHRGSDRLSGERMVIDLSTGLSSVDGGARGAGGGRVTGTFSPVRSGT